MFLKHRNWTYAAVEGRGLIGYTKLTKTAARRLLGVPTKRPAGDGKVTHEWILSFGSITLSLYNYKDSKHLHVGAKQLDREVAIHLLGTLGIEVEAT